MIAPERLRELMELAIGEAAKSKPEDAGIHPRVGALLASAEGAVLHTAHRGERGAGDHAEFICLAKAEEAGTDLRASALFVTLEPCTARGAGKTPCTTRILSSGIKKIYIGMLDPNLVICGRGETRLRYQIEVERFPNELIRGIEELNGKFMLLHRDTHLSTSSLYVKLQIPDLIRQYLAGKGVLIPDLPTDWDVTASDLVSFCSNVVGYGAAVVPRLPQMIREALGYAFDKKYATYTYDQDSRGLGDHWIRELRSVLSGLGAGDYESRRVLVVGIGNGLEGDELYVGCRNITAVDIAPESLESARRRIPGARFVVAAAEDIESVQAASIDVYLALRTYQSSYFDRSNAVREGHRVVRQGGVVAISIANGFLEQGSLIPGLVIPGTGIVDRNRPFIVADEVRRKLTLLRFEEIGIRTTMDEIIVFGRRGR